MRFLVTGGAGNIGASLVAKLVSNPNNVVYVADNLSTGRIENLASVRDSISFLQLDANSPLFLESVKSEIDELDYIIHLAAVVGVERTLNDPLKVLGDVEGFYNVCKLGLLYNVNKVLFSSSSEVYGEPVCHPQNELTTPLNAKLPYAVTKLVGEKVFESYKKIHGLDYSIMRFFNTYGPMQSTDFVISKFINQALNGEDITVIGDGSQTRSFCYIDDNIDTILELFEHDIPLINIGSDIEISMLDLAKLVLEVTDSKSRIIHLPSRAEGDMDRRCADNTLMKSILARELCSLSDGIRSTAEFQVHAR